MLTRPGGPGCSRPPLPGCASRRAAGCDSETAVTTTVVSGFRKTRASGETFSRPSSTIRRCGRPAAIPSRRSSRGSSCRTVPAPTRTASYSSRKRSARRRAFGAVIQRLEPVPDAVFPSSVDAHFARTKGRPCDIHVRNFSFCRSACRRTPGPAKTTSIPCRRSCRSPRRADAIGFGSARRDEDAPDSRGGDPRRARRSPTLVRARLQRHVEVGASCAAAGAIQGHDLGVRPSGPAVPGLRDDPAARARPPRRPSGWATPCTGRAPRARAPAQRRPPRPIGSTRGAAHGRLLRQRLRGARARTRAGSKGTRSSTPSPTPTKRTGSPSSR